MTTLIERKRISRDLSGNAATVLWALIFAGAAITETDLADSWTDMSRPSVKQGLNRLNEYGLVTYHGKTSGWQVNLNQLRLWQGHDGLFLSEKATVSPSGSSFASPQPEYAPAPVDNSVDDHAETTTPTDTNCKNFTIPIRSDQIRSLNQSTSDFDLKNQSDLISLIEFFTIEPPNSDRLIAQQADASLFLGWLLWANCQDWVTKPHGWAIKATLNPKRPLERNYQQLAQWLLSLTPEECSEIDYQFNGRPFLDAYSLTCVIEESLEKKVPAAIADLIYTVSKAGHSQALWRICDAE